MDHQKNIQTLFGCFFIQADEGGLGWNQRAMRVVWHHAPACMESAVRLYFRRLDSIRDFVAIPCRNKLRIPYTPAAWFGWERKSMAKNLLLEYSESLACEIAKLCKNYKMDANVVYQIKKSSSSVFANISEAQYPQSLADMLSKFEIARKECAETESWLKLIFSSGSIDESTFKKYRNLCGRIRRMLTSSCITIESRLKQGWGLFFAFCYIIGI